MELVQRYRDSFDRYVVNDPTLAKVLIPLEKRTNVKRQYLAYGAMAVAVTWLMFGYGAQLLCNVIGFIYPAYCSIKAIESRVVDDDKQWLMYWVVFAIFSVMEFFSDLVCSWIPFYWLLKCAFLIWCMSPLKGAEKIYSGVVLPWFLKNSGAVDNAINKGKERLNDIAGQAMKASSALASEVKQD